jgi:hypothetical protein
MRKIKLSKTYKSTEKNEKKLQTYVYERLLRNCKKTGN